MKLSGENMRLYAVTDRHWLGERTLAEDVEKVLKGGATFVQLREKNLDAEAFLQEAIEIRKLCNQYGVPFVINDNVEIALASGADGVHVGQDDMAAGEVRAKLGADRIIGVSTHSVEEAVLAEQQGADYIGVGAAFPTNSKGDAKPISHETYHNITQAVSIPVVAIGGITKNNVSELAGSGIDGVAVISAIFGQSDIEGSTRELKAIVEKIL